MKVSLVVPFIDQYDKLEQCITTAVANAGGEFELVTIDNGSVTDGDFFIEHTPLVSVHNEVNSGVLATYKQGLERSSGDIVLFIHSDVLIHETEWAPKLSAVFDQLPELGLGGFFGARGIGIDGGRIDSFSNMAGKVWGGCECHEPAAKHHGAQVEVVKPATVLDGLAMAFRREVLQRLIDETDMFADWRAPHHFYDKILSMKTLQLGYKVAVIPFQFDHFSGATANHSEVYRNTMTKWLQDHGHPGEGDGGVYAVAEKQMFTEFVDKWPITVGEDWQYFSKGQPWV